MAPGTVAGDSRKGNPAVPDDDATSALREKYRRVFIEKLTRKDLEELRFFLKNQVVHDRIDEKYRQKLEWKLRQYFHEEVLRREFASIEALLKTLRPEDLET